MMRNHRNSLILISLLAVMLTCGRSQSAVDPALLAKANAGDAAAQVELGDSYAKGTGAARTARQLAEDYKLAADWYRKAAELGLVAGELRLAALYRDGQGVARDLVQSASWYRRAAEQGDATAQATLGLLYSLGRGVPQDNVEAYFWLELASAVKGPNQEKYTANRLTVGAHLTTDEVAAVEERVAAWKAAHPR